MQLAPATISTHFPGRHYHHFDSVSLLFVFNTYITARIDVRVLRTYVRTRASTRRFYDTLVEDANDGTSLRMCIVHTRFMNMRNRSGTLSCALKWTYFFHDFEYMHML